MQIVLSAASSDSARQAWIKSIKDKIAELQKRITKLPKNRLVVKRRHKLRIQNLKAELTKAKQKGSRVPADFKELDPKTQNLREQLEDAQIQLRGEMEFVRSVKRDGLKPKAGDLKSLEKAKQLVAKLKQKLKAAS